MNQLTKINQLNKLYAEFFKLVDHRMSIEKMESDNDMPYVEKVNLINTLSSSIDEVRREIKMLKNKSRQYNTAEMMKAVDSYVHCTTNFNKSITVTRTLMSAQKSIYKAAITKLDGTKVNMPVTIQSDGMMYAFEGSVIRNIAEFIK